MNISSGHTIHNIFIYKYIYQFKLIYFWSYKWTCAIVLFNGFKISCSKRFSFINNYHVRLTELPFGVIKMLCITALYVYLKTIPVPFHSSFIVVLIYYKRLLNLLYCGLDGETHFWLSISHFSFNHIHKITDTNFLRKKKAKYFNIILISIVYSFYLLIHVKYKGTMNGVCVCVIELLFILCLECEHMWYAEWE